MPDILQTEMLGLYEIYKKPTLFLSNFCKREESDATSFEIDKRILQSPYAVDTQRNRPGHTVDFIGYKTEEFTPPEYNDNAVITMDELDKKLAGRDRYDPAQYQGALLDLVNDRQTKISDMYRRSEEKQVSDGLFTGQVKYFDGTTVDYKKHKDQSVAVSKSWSSAEGLALTDLDKGCDVSINLGRNAGGEFVFISRGSCIGSLIKNKETQEVAGAYKKIDRVDISMPLEKSPGAKYQGMVSTNNGHIIDLWSYDQTCDIPKGFNLAGEGSKLPYIPEGGGILFPKNILFEMKYAAVYPGDAEGVEALNKIRCQQLPWAYVKRDKGCVWVECGVKSRVLFMPTDFRSYVTYTNILGS